MKEISRQDIIHNIAIIKINNSYREGMSELELYDITRGCWKRKLESVNVVEYVLSVAFGEVKEVYKVDSWVPASELNRETIPFDAEIEDGRIGFHGKVADEEIRQKYINKSVAGLFKQGEADPVKVILASALNRSVTGDINRPAKPVLITQTEGNSIVVCPRCEESFIQAARCPECGQLIDYSTLSKKDKLDYGELLDGLNLCRTKYDLVITLNKYGLKTSTEPTKTGNINDLYFQLDDGSRIQIGVTVIKLWTCETISKNTYFSHYPFKEVNDGSYRTKRLTLPKSEENLKLLLEFFLENENNWIEG